MKLILSVSIAFTAIFSLVHFQGAVAAENKNIKASTECEMGLDPSLVTLWTHHEAQLKEKGISDLEIRLHDVFHGRILDPSKVTQAESDLGRINRIHGELTLEDYYFLYNKILAGRRQVPFGAKEVNFEKLNSTRERLHQLLYNASFNPHHVDADPVFNQLVRESLPELNLTVRGMSFNERLTAVNEIQRLVKTTENPDALALLEKKLTDGKIITGWEAEWLLHQIDYSLRPHENVFPLGGGRQQMLDEIERKLLETQASRRNNETYVPGSQPLLTKLTVPQGKMLVEELLPFVIGDQKRYERLAEFREAAQFFADNDGARGYLLYLELNGGNVSSGYMKKLAPIIDYYSRDYLLEIETGFTNDFSYRNEILAKLRGELEEPLFTNQLYYIASRIDFPNFMTSPK